MAIQASAPSSTFARALPGLTLRARSLATWAGAAGAAVRRQGFVEWYGAPIHLMLLARPRPEGLGATPRDFRAVKPRVGRALLAGVVPLDGMTLEMGAGGDPWNRPSPSRRFALALHQFGWMHHLTAAGDDGPREGLRLTLEWQRVFGRWNGFAWSPEALERRVFNLACALRRIAVGASDAERATLTQSLARQARHLAGLPRDLVREAERACAIAAAGAALAGAAGERLADKGLARLERVLPLAVLPDGGHATRAPEAALQLLFDLLTVDDALLQLGREPPEELARAIDRLTAAQRFFTLPDGRLACAQGGEEGDPEEIEAARAHDDGDAPAPAPGAPHGL